MKKLFALIILLCCTLALCCAPKPPPARIVKEPDITKVVVWRDFEITLHVDTAFDGDGRVLIERAAANVRRLTHDRARIALVFDLDFHSTLNLEEHRRDSQLVGVLSTFPLVATLEAGVAGEGTLMAATATTKYQSTWVFLIMDRIEDDEFETTLTHEFGHVIGLPDLEVMGAVMSRAQQRNVRVPKDWTPADVELCRSYRYCD